jgi:hypothetical protein
MRKVEKGDRRRENRQVVTLRKERRQGPADEDDARVRWEIGNSLLLL